MHVAQRPVAPHAVDVSYEAMRTPYSQPEDRRHRAAIKFGRSWVAFALALAIHVTDEALTDFLAVYNPTVLAIRARIPWIPLPTFSFRIWIVGLTAVIVLLFSLSRCAFRGRRWIVAAAIPLSVLMIGNGLGHIGSSIYMGRFMPGVYSSPVLIAVSLLTFIYAVRLHGVMPEKA